MLSFLICIYQHYRLISCSFHFIAGIKAIEYFWWVLQDDSLSSFVWSLEGIGVVLEDTSAVQTEIHLSVLILRPCCKARIKQSFIQMTDSILDFAVLTHKPLWSCTERIKWCVIVRIISTVSEAALHEDYMLFRIPCCDTWTWHPVKGIFRCKFNPWTKSPWDCVRLPLERSS